MGGDDRVSSGVKPAPAYALLYPVMADMARDHGYALALHGSMARDLDVIAVPWADSAERPEVFVSDVVRWLRQVYDSAAWYVSGDDVPERKPHGRLAWRISLGGSAYLDLSVVPPTCSATEVSGG